MGTFERARTLMHGSAQRATQQHGSVPPRTADAPQGSEQGPASSIVPTMPATACTTLYLGSFLVLSFLV